ncbi:GAS2-like protein pickled eggs [Culicoides brevitarsis]|uniref:GAS2-like protein pickled eggs n=1 Tax=Culicoides brevitarsis TaxID=469753 RepID=UPI00307CC55A
MAATVLLEARPYRPFKSSEEYLYAMREDLAEWLNTMYPELEINVENFMDRLDTGVALCKHANNVREAAEEYLARRQARQKSMTKSITSGSAGPILSLGNVHYLPLAKSGTFFARDNVSNFITWCRKGLHIFECLLFETDDLIMRKNEKHVILCLLEVARRGAKFGMLAPMLVQMERQIDREIAADNRANGVGCGTQTEINGKNSMSTETEGFESDSDEEEDDDNGPMLMYGPMPQIITNDLKSLDEMVRDLVEKCTCPTQFPMIRVSEGKYRIGDTKVLIFVRILRSHVMVRVGGGWDTLSHYLDKHDPCRCRAQHRSAVAARIMTRTNANNGIELHKAQVYYERSPPVTRKFNNGIGSPTTAHNVTSQATATNSNALSPQTNVRSRSRSPSQRNGIDKTKLSQIPRSASPNTKRVSDKEKKRQLSFESNIVIPLNPQEISTQATMQETKADLPTESVNKYENVSDNGSEISDEGYRSLGLIQNGKGDKRSSMLSQASNEDAENIVRLDQNTPDSSCEEQCLKIVENETIEPLDTTMPVAVDVIDSTELPNEDGPQENFTKSGITITDDVIMLDISNNTGLRKTGFSEQIYNENLSSNKKKNLVSKIPRSPMPIRRRSVENLCMTEMETGLPLSRKIPQYRSVRKPTASSMAKETPKENTWSGRTTKRRPSLQNDTFQQSSSKPNSPSPNRKIISNANRSQQAQYDQNGRRIKPISASANTSPIKNRIVSPLAQQFLEVAGEAKDDAQFLAKMKALLEQYTSKKTSSSVNNKYSDNDFTTAWVNGNGSVVDDEHDIGNNTTPKKTSSSSSEISTPKETSGSTKRISGLSRIPAPVRSNTGMY